MVSRYVLLSNSRKAYRVRFVPNVGKCCCSSLVLRFTFDVLGSVDSRHTETLQSFTLQQSEFIMYQSKVEVLNFTISSILERFVVIPLLATCHFRAETRSSVVLLGKTMAACLRHSVTRPRYVTQPMLNNYGLKISITG